MPVVGFLHSQSLAQYENSVAAFLEGLGELGFAEGKNVIIDFRWAEGNPDRLARLATELVRIPVAVLVAGGGNLSVLAAREATKTIPIVFPGSDDPVKLGVVDSFNRPGGNATGVSLFNSVLAAKRFDLLHTLLPKATLIAVLLNPKNPNTPGQLKEIEEAARSRNQSIQVLYASSGNDIDAAFAMFSEKRADALIIGADPFYQSNRAQLLQLAARHALPTIYFQREFVLAGGLISYGVHFPDAYHQAGRYTGRILKGEKPAELPVVQLTRIELTINLKTAKSVGLNVPATLIALADEVIE
jgi:putative ABC transport system substrate-binding protein